MAESTAVTTPPGATRVPLTRDTDDFRWSAVIVCIEGGETTQPFRLAERG